MHIVNALPAPERAAIFARASAAIVAARDAGRTEVAAAQAKQRVLESAARAHILLGEPQRALIFHASPTPSPRLACCDRRLGC